MCEIDVSRVWDLECPLISGSQAELGPDAGKITWRNALAAAEDYPIVTDENRDDVRDHFAEYGAWDREEINAWSDTELSAMIWQEAASDMRHFQEHCNGDFARYEADCERGQVSGRLMLEPMAMGEKTAIIYLGL